MPNRMMSLEEPRALEQAIAAIAHGGVVAFPTDTVYGIGASLAHEAALERIFDIKGRDRERSLPVILSSPSEIGQVAGDVPPMLLELAKMFWPGPLTVAMPALPSVPSQAVAADGTVGVRVPNHSVALVLAQRNGGAIAATSANLSGRPPAIRASELEDALTEHLDLVLDGGITPGGLASTVITLNGDTIIVIREGAISGSTIQDAWRSILHTHMESVDPDTGTLSVPS